MKLNIPSTLAHEIPALLEHAASHAGPGVAEEKRRCPEYCCLVMPSTAGLALMALADRYVSGSADLWAILQRDLAAAATFVAAYPC